MGSGGGRDAALKESWISVSKSERGGGDEDGGSLHTQSLVSRAGALQKSRPRLAHLLVLTTLPTSGPEAAGRPPATQRRVPCAGP